MRKFKEQPKIDFAKLITLMKGKNISFTQVAIDADCHFNTIYHYTRRKRNSPKAEIARLIYNLAVRHLTDAEIQSCIIPENRR